MESWSFPPRYDEHFFPDAKSRYWFAQRETMPAAEREKLILERLKLVCAYAYERAPFYRRKWDEAGFHPSQIRSLQDFEEKVPVVEKKDLRIAQERAAPFGDYLCVPESEVFHIHGTSEPEWLERLHCPASSHTVDDSDSSIRRAAFASRIR